MSKSLADCQPRKLLKMQSWGRRISIPILKAAAKIARQAGDFLLVLIRLKRSILKAKLTLVTAFDRQSEEMIFNELNGLSLASTFWPKKVSEE